MFTFIDNTYSVTSLGVTKNSTQAFETCSNLSSSLSPFSITNFYGFKKISFLSGSNMLFIVQLE